MIRRWPRTPFVRGPQPWTLRRVLRDAALRRGLADAALEECRAVYSWSKVGGQIMDVYSTVAGQAPDLAWPTVLPTTPCRFRDEPHLL